MQEPQVAWFDNARACLRILRLALAVMYAGQTLREPLPA
jgi:hypothetical protein